MFLCNAKYQKSLQTWKMPSRHLVHFILPAIYRKHNCFNCYIFYILNFYLRSITWIKYHMGWATWSNPIQHYNMMLCGCQSHQPMLTTRLINWLIVEDRFVSFRLLCVLLIVIVFNCPSVSQWRHIYLYIHTPDSTLNRS